MKTTWQAVNELRGDLNNTYLYEEDGQEYLFFVDDDTDDQWVVGRESKETGNEHLICTVSEFNALVAEMETNFGKYKSMTILDVVHYRKGVEVDDRYEYAFNAPESDAIFTSTSTYRQLPAHCYKKICLVEEYNKLIKQYATNFGKCTQSYAEYKDSLSVSAVKSEKAKPQYTQAMYEAGELPSVGMECLGLADDGWHKIEVLCWKKNTSDIDVAACRIISEEHGNCGKLYWVVDFKPITPQVELIDGNAYQFDFNNISEIGLYVEGDDEFYSLGCNFSVDMCTNIKQLTVKES